MSKKKELTVLEAKAKRKEAAIAKAAKATKAKMEAVEKKAKATKPEKASQFSAPAPAKKKTGK